MHQILAAGADSSLLYIRSLVLIKSGAPVKTALPDEALLLLNSGEFDLLVLCHSLTQRELQILTVAARACARPVKTLLIESPGIFRASRVGVDSRFPLENGPDRLILSVQALLASLDTMPPAPGLRLVPSIQPRIRAPRMSALLDDQAQIQSIPSNLSFSKAQK